MTSPRPGASIPFLAQLSDPGRPGDPGAGSGPPSTYRVLSRHGEVRSLLPADDRRRLRRSLAHANGPETPTRHHARRAYALLASTSSRPGALVRIDDAGLRGVLAELVGHDPRSLHLAVHFGPPRANRKPVVQVLRPDGSLLAVAKLAVSRLTGELVAHEDRALRRLAAADLPPDLVVPEPLGTRPWAGGSLLVQSALDLPARRQVPGPTERHHAEAGLVELAGGPSHEAPAWARDLRDRLAVLSGHPTAQRLAGTVDELLAADWLAEVGTGASHGDWSPQNLSRLPGGVAVWDWERFAEHRPLGYDAAHLVLQEGLRRAPSRGNLLAAATRALAPWHRPESPEQVADLARLVVLDLAARYLGDGQRGTGSPGARLVRLVAPAEHRSSTPTPTSRRQS